jgi:hypothetical protein
MSKPPFLCQDISQVATEKDALRDQIRHVEALRDRQAKDYEEELAAKKKELDKV